MIHPFMPAAAAKLASFFGKTIGDAGGLAWADIGTFGRDRESGLTTVVAPEVLFAKLEDDRVDELRERYSGTQKERADRDAAKASTDTKAAAKSAAVPAQSDTPPEPSPRPMPIEGLPIEERFERLIDLRVAKIIKIERHPKADKLYIETLDDGSGTDRVIVSGLVPYYKEEDLLGKSIVLVNNLKPAKLRGVESRGMLLAASRKVEGEGGVSVKEAVEVLDAGDMAPGTRLSLEGREALLEGREAELSGATPMIDADTFFSVPISANDGFAFIGSKRLVALSRPFALTRVRDGEVG
jgi:methionyl-tRNA synthetase